MTYLKIYQKCIHVYSQLCHLVPLISLLCPQPAQVCSHHSNHLKCKLKLVTLMFKTFQSLLCQSKSYSPNPSRYFLSPHCLSGSSRLTGSLVFLRNIPHVKTFAVPSAWNAHTSGIWKPVPLFPSSFLPNVLSKVTFPVRYFLTKLFQFCKDFPLSLFPSLLFIPSS